MYQVSHSCPRAHPLEGGREVKHTCQRESQRRLRAALRQLEGTSTWPLFHWPLSSATTASPPGDCGANVCKWGNLSPRRAVAGFVAVVYAEFHTQEPLPFFPAEHLGHQNDCLALGTISKPTECGCSDIIQAPARSRGLAGR